LVEVAGFDGLTLVEVAGFDESTLVEVAGFNGLNLLEFVGFGVSTLLEISYYDGSTLVEVACFDCPTMVADLDGSTLAPSAFLMLSAAPSSTVSWPDEASLFSYGLPIAPEIVKAISCTALQALPRAIIASGFVGFSLYRLYPYSIFSYRV